MSYTHWIVLTVVGLAVVVGLSACHPRAAYKAHFGTDQERAEYHVDYAVKRLTKKLDLTDEQQARVREMALDVKSKIVAHHQDREKTKAEMISLVSQERITPQEITDRVEAKLKQHRPMLDLMAKNLAELHGMLTPDQRAKLIEEIKNHEHGQCRFGRKWRDS